jgi:hypothetical protein
MSHKTEAKVYQLRVSLDLMVEAHDLEEVHSILNNWLDVMGEVPNSPGVLGWDDIDSEDPIVIEGGE